MITFKEWLKEHGRSNRYSLMGFKMPDDDMLPTYTAEMVYELGLRDEAVLDRLDKIISLLEQMNKRDAWFEEQQKIALSTAQESADKLVDDVIVRIKEQFEQDRIEKARAAAGGVKQQ